MVVCDVAVTIGTTSIHSSFERIIALCKTSARRYLL